MRYSFVFSVLCCVCFFSFGCGDKRPDGMPKPVSCTLTVQFEDGSPVEDANIRLIPEDSANKWAAGGKTNAAGKLEVKTSGEYLGVIPGKYKVICTKTESIPTGQKSEEGDEMMKVNHLIHPSFSSAAKTTLTLEVQNSPVNETLVVKKP